MAKDWIGNKQSTFSTLGASNHTNDVRAEHDYYATDPRAVELLLAEETFSYHIWEPACGAGHISEVLKKHGHTVYSTDLVYRNYGDDQLDFLANTAPFSGDIITNPPYKYAKEFVEKSIEVIPDGFKVAMFLKLQFLEGKARKTLFKKYPPYRVYVSSSRLSCAKNGDFTGNLVNAVAYAWFVWIKGYKGCSVLRWIN